METRILIVDDEKLIRTTLELRLQDEGFNVGTAANAFEALEILGSEAVGLIVTDLRMPSMDGLEFQCIVRERWPDTSIIFMTAYGTVATAVEAMREGAADYLTKPLNTDELVIRIRRLTQQNRQIDELRRCKVASAKQRILGKLVYRSAAMAAVVERALAIADTDATVLIEGETGTGKEVLAMAIHDNSTRSAGPFVAVNCAGLNPNLVESELFGHEAGAFTGAIKQRRGRIESAFGGTLLIDEVDDLTPEIQIRLLRFLNDRTYERVGSDRMLRGDVRVICATKKSLPELVKAGRFRDDLYYRINTVPIMLPPLRARLEEVVSLAEHFTRKLWGIRGFESEPVLLPETLRLLLAYTWPGNVRELMHAMEHAVAFSRGAPIGPQHLPPQLVFGVQAPIVQLNIEGLEKVSFDEVVATCERKLIDWALIQTNGNQVQSAELLGLSRSTFRSRHAALRGETKSQIDES